jgi:GLPGLI family protein
MKKYIIIFRKVLIFCIVITLHTSIVFSQTLYRGGSDTKKLIDTCKYAVTYAFKYIEDTVKKEPYYDRQILEIGNRYSHFGSIWADKVDSVEYNIINNKKYVRPNKDGSDGVNAEKEAGLQINEKPKYEDYYINYPNKGDLTVSIAIELYEFRYTESISKFEWKIQSDTTTILGYKCIKAITTFRGRNYEVWFTPFIPIRKGPWKFNGLPGLILQVTDTKGYFAWTATGFEKTENKYIYIHELDKKRMTITDRKEIMKLQRKQWEDPVGLIISQGQKIMIRTQNGHFVSGYSGAYKFPYIPPLELE